MNKKNHSTALNKTVRIHGVKYRLYRRKTLKGLLPKGSTYAHAFDFEKRRIYITEDVDVSSYFLGIAMAESAPRVTTSHGRVRQRPDKITSSKIHIGGKPYTFKFSRERQIVNGVERLWVVDPFACEIRFSLAVRKQLVAAISSARRWAAKPAKGARHA